MDCERMKKYTQEEERIRQRRRVVQMMFDNTLNVDSTGSKVTAHDLNQRILKAVVLKKDKEGGGFFLRLTKHTNTLYTRTNLRLSFPSCQPLLWRLLSFASSHCFGHGCLFSLKKKERKKKKEERREK